LSSAISTSSAFTAHAGGREVEVAGLVGALAITLMLLVALELLRNLP
jgi:hypothetical protein